MAQAELYSSQLFPGSYSANNLMIDSLVISFQNFEQQIIMDSLLNEELLKLDLHINEYFLLVPNGFKALKLLENTSVAVGNFFGVGNVVSSAFVNAKDYKITPKKAKKLIKHIEKGSPIAKESSLEIDKYLEIIINTDIPKEKESLKNRYISFLKGLREKSDSYEYYSKYNTIFIKNYKRIYFTELLAKQLVKANQQTRVSHLEIKKMSSKRQKLDQDLESIQELFMQINQIKKTIGQLEALEK